MGALRPTSSLCQAETHSNWASRKLESSKMATPRLTVLRISVITGENKCINGDPRSTGKNACHSVAGFWGILSFCMLRESLSKTFDLAFPDAKHQDAVHLCPFYFLLTLSGFMWFAPFACLWIFVDTSGCLRNQTDQTCWHHCRWNSEMSLAVMVPKRSWWKWWISWKTPPGLRLPQLYIIRVNKQWDLPTVDVILLNMLMSSCYVLLMLEFPSLLTYGGWFCFFWVLPP